MLMLYFSGTGNSKYIAKLFCRNMNAQCHSIEENINFVQLIFSHEKIGFCYPIYGSRVPRIMREFVCRYIECLKDKKIVIFCTQLIFSGDGARVFTDMFSRDYVKVIYAEHFYMPNNVNNLFFLPIENDKIINKKLENAERKMKIVCDNINNRKIIKRGFNIFSRFLGLFQGIFMPMLERKALDNVMVYDKCTLCGLCVSICPMCNFKKLNGKIVTKGNCTMCYRCINKCPENAIAVFLKTKINRQYKGLSD